MNSKLARALLVMCGMANAVHAQTAAEPAAAPAASSPAKKDLAQRIVQMQTPAVEALARQLAEQPAQQLLGQAQMVLMQRVAADKRQALWQALEGDARRYVEEATPIVRERALKVAPDAMSPILESRLSEDELRQVLQVMQAMESPAFRKYASLGPELQRALSEKTVAEARAAVDSKVRAMQEAANKRLPAPATQQGGAPAGGGAAGGAASPAATNPPAKKP